MPKPVKRGNTFYARIRVPSDLAEQLQGTTLTVPIGNALHSVRLTTHLATSLRTQDALEAKRRLSEVLSAAQNHWAAVRNGPERTDFKTLLSIAGEIRAQWISLTDANPGAVGLWEGVQAADKLAQQGVANPLQVPVEGSRERELEKRYGPLVDAFLAARHRILESTSRAKLIELTAQAMAEVAEVNLKKASGDYSDSGETKKYPQFVAEKQRKRVVEAKEDLTFSKVVDNREALKKSGSNGKHMPQKTAAKYRNAAAEFVAFRKDPLIATVTVREADAWKRAMLDAEELSNRTVKQRLQNLRTVIEWARRAELGDLFPERNPLDLLELPQVMERPEGETAYKLHEAETVLKAARLEQKPELRWVPWICAYTGARVGEIEQLSANSFFQVGADWFISITTMGGRSLKVSASERRVPLHPDLITEGILEFVSQAGQEPDARLFSRYSGNWIGEWVRNDLGLSRELLAPNHGWRHLFEDRATGTGMSDAAKLYITGRSGGGSARGYGKSEALLPGLAVEMRKLPSYL